MGNFDRGGRGGGFRPRFGNRDSERQMHRAICDKCGKECEVPFRPSGDKPIFCSSCFENNRGAERSTNFEDRPMFEAVCDECGNSCKVPFQPRGGKPIYCSNCFGDKKGNGNRNTGQPESPQSSEQFEALNAKLDQILKMLTPVISPEVTKPKKAASLKKK